MNKDIDFINDFSHLNDRYRKGLMQLFESQGYFVRSIGVFSRDGMAAIISRGNFIISSNLRANLLVLFLDRKTP